MTGVFIDGDYFCIVKNINSFDLVAAIIGTKDVHIGSCDDGIVVCYAEPSQSRNFQKNVLGGRVAKALGYFSLHQMDRCFVWGPVLFLDDSLLIGKDCPSLIRSQVDMLVVLYKCFHRAMHPLESGDIWHSVMPAIDASSLLVFSDIKKIQFNKLKLSPVPTTTSTTSTANSTESNKNLKNENNC
jgi:hypothetical protein